MQKFISLTIRISPKSSYSLSPIDREQCGAYIQRIGTMGVNDFMNTVKMLFLRATFIVAVCFAIAASMHADTIMPNFNAAIQGVDYFNFDRVVNDGANHNRTHARPIWGRSFGDIADGADPAILGQWISAARPAVLMSASAASEKHAKSLVLKEEGDDTGGVDKKDVADSTDSAILSAETGFASGGFAGAGLGMGAGGAWNFNPWFGGLPVPGFTAATTASTGNFVTDAAPTNAAATLGASDDPTSAAVPEAGSCFLLGFGLILVTVMGIRYRRYHPIRV
jgi:hypothetical protein